MPTRFNGTQTRTDGANFTPSSREISKGNVIVRRQARQDRRANRSF